MLRSYYKIAWRSLTKNLSASVINLIGLSVGFTCVMLMVLYMQHDLSFDRFQLKGDRIARVIMQYSFGGSEVTSGNFTSTKVLPSFKKNFPEVIDGVRIYDASRIVLYKDRLFNEEGFVYSDSSFFSIFNFQLLRGGIRQVLTEPYQVVITQSTALKYFGQEDPIGKVLKVGSDQMNYTVIGVSEDCPSNSQIRYDFLASFSSLGPAQEESYFEANYTTYLLFRDASSIDGLQQKIGPFMKGEMDTQEPGAYINYIFEPFCRVHLYSEYDAMVPNSNIRYIYIIAGIALLVLIIACFTYINLSTARSIERAREVGIRKVAGAMRYQLFAQFISESFLITMIAGIISLGLVALVLSSFNELVGKQLHFSDLGRPGILLVMAGIVILISLFAGSYPALILSDFQPIKVLKGAFKNSSSGTWLRHSLIVFQFVISVFLIASTIIIGSQMRYIQNKKLGYERDHVIITRIDQKMLDKIDLIKTELKSNPNVLSVTKANFSPVHIPGGYVMSRGDQTIDQSINTRGNNIDEDYIKTNGLDIIAGSDLHHQDMVDVSKEDYKDNYFHFVLNEAAVKALGWTTEEAVGKKMYLGDGRPGEVKAVVRDFHFTSLHNTIEPLVLFPSTWGSTMMIKISGADLAGTISFLGNKWKTLAAHRPFEYHFMDEDFSKLYDAENRVAKVFNIFSGISILLACLGLFGLSAFAAKQRMKELSVRKVLGASVADIILILSGKFVKMIFLAFLIAIPLIWISMNAWLSDFYYRIHIKWWMFALAGASALSVAMLTVSIQAIRAAVANPIKSLRTE